MSRKQLQPLHVRSLMLNRLAFLLFALVVVSSQAAADPTEVTVPAPGGLRPCTPQDPTSPALEHSVAKFGEYLGCFLSEEKVVLRGSHRVATQPLKYAYAVRVPSGPYSPSDVEDLFLKVSDQWKNYQPLDKRARADYDKKINDLLGSAFPTAASGVAVSIQPPVLVSIRRIGTDAYAVVSVRQRKLTLPDDVIVSTAVDASAIALKGDSMLRLSLVREMRASADVSNVEDAITEWIRAVKAAESK